MLRVVIERLAICSNGGSMMARGCMNAGDGRTMGAGKAKAQHVAAGCDVWFTSAPTPFQIAPVAEQILGESTGLEIPAPSRVVA